MGKIIRYWLIAAVDVDEDDGPIAEPTVLASTKDIKVAENLLGCLVSAEKKDAKNNSVRSSVEALPIEVQEVLETKPRSMLDDMLEDYHSNSSDDLKAKAIEDEMAGKEEFESDCIKKK